METVTPVHRAQIPVVAPNPASKNPTMLTPTVMRSNSETSKSALSNAKSTGNHEETERKRAYSEPVNLDKSNIPKDFDTGEICTAPSADLCAYSTDPKLRASSPVDPTADLTQTLENMAVFEVPASLLTEGLPLLKVSHKARKKIRLWVDSSEFKFVYKHESKNKTHSFYIDDLRSVTPRELASHYREEFGISKEAEKRWISVAYFDHRKNKTKHLHLIAETSHDSKRLLYTVCKFKAIWDRIAADFLVDLKDLDEVKRSILSGKAAVSEKAKSKSPKQVLSFQEVVKYCRRLSINVPEEKLHSLFSKATSSSKDEIDFEEFKKFVTLLTRRNDIRSIFARFSSTENMTLEEFGKFLAAVQGEKLDVQSVTNIYHKFATPGEKSDQAQASLNRGCKDVPIQSQVESVQDSNASTESEIIKRNSIKASKSSFADSIESIDSVISVASKYESFAFGGRKHSMIHSEDEIEPCTVTASRESRGSDATETARTPKTDNYKPTPEAKSNILENPNLSGFCFTPLPETDQSSNLEHAAGETPLDPKCPMLKTKRDSKLLMKLSSQLAPSKHLKSGSSSQVDSVNSGNRSTTSETEPPSESGIDSDTDAGILTKTHPVESAREVHNHVSSAQNPPSINPGDAETELAASYPAGITSHKQDTSPGAIASGAESSGVKSMVDSVLGDHPLNDEIPKTSQTTAQNKPSLNMANLVLKQPAALLHNAALITIPTKLKPEQATHFGPECLAAYLKSPVCAPSKSTYMADDSYFSHPLTDYYILSSHNTYLTGRQVAGDSSVEGYVKALQRGCRCLEIDVWDQADPNLEPIVNHGRTFTTGISLTNVLLTIKKFAFQTTRFPLILSLEVRCSTRAQVIMAQIIKDVFGPSLITKPIDSRMTVPSPAELKDKVLIKVKRSDKPGPKGSESLSSLDENGRFVNSSTQTSYSESNESGAAPKFKLRRKDANKIAEPLSKLGVYCQGIKFRNFSLPESKTYNHIFSLSEKSANAMLRDPEKAAALDKHNRKFFMRIYPSKIRLNSSNFVPLVYWEHGVQMVATNWQRYDLGQQINEAFFDITQACGYVLKPAELRKAVMKATLREHVVAKREAVTRFRIEIVSAQQLPNVHNVAGTEIVNPFVTVEILGAHAHTWDLHSRTGPSEVVAENGFNPKWNVVYSGNFTADTQLVFLRLAVHTSASKTAVESPKEICVSVTNIFDLKQGYRHLPLKDLCGELLTYSSVFVNVKYETKI